MSARVNANARNGKASKFADRARDAGRARVVMAREIAGSQARTTTTIGLAHVRAMADGVRTAMKAEGKARRRSEYHARSASEKHLLADVKISV